MGNALFVHGGVTSAVEARLGLAGLLALQGSGVDVRTGVLWGPGTTALITGTAATAPMQIAIAVHDGISSRGVANGPYLMSTEAVQLVNIGAAPASGTRIDVVYEKQQDNTPGIPAPDGTTGPLYGVQAGVDGGGEPSIATIVGAKKLGTVAVSAGATRTTDGTVLITNTVEQTVARGADVPVRTVAERDAYKTGMGGLVGLTVKRLDLGGRVERWTGSAWADPSDVPVLASIAARNTYFTGNLRAGASALVAGNTHVYDGGAWRFTLAGKVDGVGTDGASIFQVQHGAGQTPLAWGASPLGQTTDTVTAKLHVIAFGADSTNLSARFAVDGDYYVGVVSFSWWAKF